MVFTSLIGRRLLWRSNAVSESIRWKLTTAFKIRSSSKLTIELGFRYHITDMWHNALMWMVHAIIINEIWHFCVLLLKRNKKRTFIGQNESTSLFLVPSGLFSVVSKSTPQMSIVSWICQLSVNIIQTLKQGHTTTPEAAFSTFCEKFEDSLRSLSTSAEKMQEMGPAVYRPVPRRLKRLTINRCHSIVSSFSPVLSRPWVLVRAWTLDLTHGSSAPKNLSRRWLNDHSGLMKMKTDVIWGPVSTWRINSETAS